MSDDNNNMLFCEVAIAGDRRMELLKTVLNGVLPLTWEMPFMHFGRGMSGQVKFWDDGQLKLPCP
jgi:hypothetical protein